MKLTPARRVVGRIRLPGDKSISHRAALIASVAEGRSRLENFSTSLDCSSTLACMEQLGARITRSGDAVTIDPPGHLRAPTAVLDCGNSGSTMRMLAGVLAGNSFTSELVGDESLSSRPMKRIIEPLQMMGATIDSIEGKPPLHIRGLSSLNPISYELPVASAQVKSCILFAALAAAGQTTVIEPTTTRDHTERLFNAFGVPVRTTKEDTAATKISINGPTRFQGGDMTIPGDISSAAYFIAASLLVPESDAILNDVGLNPTRTAFVDLLRAWGGSVETADERTERNETIGTLRARNGDIVARARERPHIAPAMIPALIDELPLIAVVGSQLHGGLEIRGASELRVKETDRIKATVNNLRTMGAEVEEYEDGLFVNGPAGLHGALVESYGDHRIAMAFSIAALIAEGESEIANASCVNISFPEFFELLHQVVKT